MGQDSELNARATQVADLSPIQLPLSRTMQFRESNLETIRLVNGPTDFDGAITDSLGSVIGLWSSFAWENGRDLQQEKTIHRHDGDIDPIHQFGLQGTSDFIDGPQRQLRRAHELRVHAAQPRGERDQLAHRRALGEPVARDPPGPDLLPAQPGQSAASASRTASRTAPADWS